MLFAHGGGAFPATLGRIEHGFRSGPDLVAVDNDKNPRDYVGRFYVDSLVHDPDMLRFMLKLMGAERIALGSDYPFPLGETVPGRMIESMDDLSPARAHACCPARRSSGSVSTGALPLMSRRRRRRRWLEHDGQRFGRGRGRGVSLAIPLDPHGAQPCISARRPRAPSRWPAAASSATRASGGSCNCESVTLVPHCNGTHTEGPGHLTRERLSVHASALRPLYAAALISVERGGCRDYGRDQRAGTAAG
jgi:hypothetical protein